MYMDFQIIMYFMCAMNPFVLFFYGPIKANKRGQKNKAKEMKNQVNKKLPSGMTY